MEGDYVASYVGDPNAALSVCDDFFHNAFFDLLFFLHFVQGILESDGIPDVGLALLVDDVEDVLRNDPTAFLAFYGRAATVAPAASAG